MLGAVGAEENDFFLVLVEVPRKKGAPARGQLVALDVTFLAADDRPLLPHESRIPTARAD